MKIWCNYSNFYLGLAGVWHAELVGEQEVPLQRHLPNSGTSGVAALVV